jgi:hypothetical protein
MSSRAPQSVGEMWPSRYLTAADVTGRVTLKIRQVTLEEFREPGTGEKTWKPVISFETLSGRQTQKSLIANKTQGHSFAQITGSERFADWPGKLIVLAPARAQNGKPTISILPPEQPAQQEKEG